MHLPASVYRILTWSALAGFALLFGEAFLRIADPQPLLPRYVTGTTWGVRGNIPHARYRHRTPEVDVEFRINGQGMRADRDFPAGRQAGICRIAVFGDSFFMGYELNLEDSFAARLEERLGRKRFNAEVLNFSVSGFGTAEMIRHYERLGRRFEPDVVIFQWHVSDPDDNVRANLFDFEDGRVVATERSYLPTAGVQDALAKFSLYRWIADQSHLYSFARERISVFVRRLMTVAQVKMESGGEERAAGAADDNPGRSEGATRYAEKLSAALLRHANDMAQREGREFFVVEIPRRLSRTSFRSSIEVLPAADLSGINVLSPLQEFQRVASDRAKLYFERGHFHLTPLGVDVLVDVVAPRIEQSAKMRICKQ